MADEGVREIQLNGKQLVFLFMTAAVVLVVTFLFGVLVGRGVRAQKETTVAGDVVEPGAAAVDPAASLVTAQSPAAAPAAQPPATPPSTPPASPPEEELSYYSRLEGDAKPGESAKKAAAPDASAANGPATPAKDPKAVKVSEESKAKPLPPAPPTPAATVNGEPAGQGYALRVAAYRDKTQADALAGRLSAKGYSTFIVQLPSAKGPGLFSVRVGKYKTQKEVNAVKRRLEKEEKLTPSPIPR